ncbi:hypothetical protein DKL61_04465 [Gammaproteobacteria bacterium ESL0073]|nr:hypothetical protein DKL61_04465 [Gammaproteobacteria bacterium ESL0073]
MARFHKLAAIGLAVTLSSVGNVFALGLGEVTWKSSLNQPLNAEIAVYDAHNITNKELIVKIASVEEFQKAGIERPYVLSDLVFTPIIKENGKGIIKVTSKQPIKEPYLDFLLSVSWASGQTLREYTLLIDPPAYTPPTAVSVKKTVKTAKAPTKPAKSVAPQATVNREPKKVASSGNAQGKTVKAFRGSSLWLLAERSRSGVSVQQAMLAIYEANPDAFLDGKMSLLKEGAVLRIPSSEQMRKTSRAEAESQVLANVTGKASTTVAPRQVLAENPTQTSNNNDVVKDQLKLAGVLEDDTKGANQQASEGSSSISLKDKIAQAAEEIDATHSKNNELRSRMLDLQSRLADMKKLIELKDDQLASLQANIGSQQQSSTTNQDNESVDQEEPVKQSNDGQDVPASQSTVANESATVDNNNPESQEAAKGNTTEKTTEQSSEPSKNQTQQ